MGTLQELLDLIHLDQDSSNLFVGSNFLTPWGRVFGGQVLAQALHAASRTVPEDRTAHSLHAYFILPGDVNVPIEYQVDRSRDGRSFTTRRVKTLKKGEIIFIMACSFQTREKGLEHQLPMPNVPGPENVLSDQEWYASLKDKLPDLYRRYQFPQPIEFRPIERYNPLAPSSQPPFRHIWMRVRDTMPEDPRIHQQVLAYASDYNLLSTAYMPHQLQARIDRVMFASLDHAMWFHEDFRMDDWLLYAVDSPSAGNSRGFTRGNIFTREGKLIASVTQEGLIRLMQPKAD